MVRLLVLFSCGVQNITGIEIFYYGGKKVKFVIVYQIYNSLNTGICNSCSL